MLTRNRITFSSTVGLLVLCTLLPSRNEAQALQASVGLTVQGQTWDYILNNLEAADSNNWLTSYYLPISAPVADILAPDNWVIDSDNSSYILWSNQEAFPYPDDIAPGLSLTGFQFTSSAPATQVSSLVSSWDHDIDDSGPTVNLSVLAPSAVPEPSSLAIIGIGAITALAIARHRRK